MEKLKIYVSGAEIHVTVLDKLTSGTVGATASFAFTPEWSGLLKTAVFVGTGATKDVILTGSAVEIPPECLTRRGTLRVGVYGHLADGTIVIPTVMCNGVEIAAGTKPSGDTQSGYTPEKWAQMLGMIGDISHLTTEDRSTLVAAINEIAGYKGMELDDDQINEVIEYYFAKHPPTIGEMTMTGDLNMGTHRVKNVADPEEDGDAVPLKYAEDHFAPAGYGLGEQAFNAPGNDANQITKCGFFRAYVNTPTGDWWTIQQEDLFGDGTYMIQKASCFAYAFVLHAERMVVDGKFYEWEWVNPPMYMGVEYRTTERWNGSVVYTKLVNCGTAINDATVTLEGVTSCVRFIGYLSYHSETDPRKQLPIWNGSTIGTGYHAEITQPASPYGINQFIIKTDSNADGFGNGGYNWYVHAWYTKD